MYYSYVMGIDSSINDLKNKGFIIQNDGDNYMVSFSKEKASIWEDFISKHLAVDFWNEFLAEDKVFLYFICKKVSKNLMYITLKMMKSSLCVKKYANANLNQ